MSETGLLLLSHFCNNSLVANNVSLSILPNKLSQRLLSDKPYGIPKLKHFVLLRSFFETKCAGTP